MPIYYLDTSAVMKRYITSEAGADFVRILLGDAAPDEIFAISYFGVLEFNAVVRRQMRSGRLMDDAMQQFEQDSLDLFRIVPSNGDTLQQALPVIQVYGLRTGDAIHLATALSIAAASDYAQVFMVTSDAELLAASETAGMDALDPQADNAIDILLSIRTQ